MSSASPFFMFSSVANLFESIKDDLDMVGKNRAD